jgi:hypothetical protein
MRATLNGGFKGIVRPSLDNSARKGQSKCLGLEKNLKSLRLMPFAPCVKILLRCYGLIALADGR